jgi:hypothetical protein
LPKVVWQPERLTLVVGIIEFGEWRLVGAYQSGVIYTDGRDAWRLRWYRPWIFLRQLNAVQRITCDERADWREQAERAGFAFHTIEGERYWDERAYYAFTLEEIENDIEAPTAEIEQMCYDLVDRAVKDERIMRALRIPERCWTLIATSWERRDRNLYGRFDLSYDGRGPAKLLEYNADTRRPYSRPRCSNGSGLSSQSRAGSFPRPRTSTTPCMSA